jgi:hypothetical protein
MMIGNRWCVLESNELFSDKDSGIARAFHTNPIFWSFYLIKGEKILGYVMNEISPKVDTSIICIECSKKGLIISHYYESIM